MDNLDKKELVVLLLAGLVLFSANMEQISLPSLDDCFYARKGIEMGRGERFFTVTWNYRPTFQNPPLQFWLLGRSFALFGENDFAARFPSLLMTLGILIGLYFIGIQTVGASASVTGIAFLLVSPYFLNNARRCMMEIPLTFWVIVAVVALLKGLQRHRLHLLLSLPVAAAILTKSVLGLLPLIVYFVAALACPQFRPPLKRPWIWTGGMLGILLGAVWMIHQELTFGWEAVSMHYMGEVGSRSAKKLDAIQFLFGYPLILLKSYQPVILPALVGGVLLWKRWKVDRNNLSILLVIWAFSPVILYSLQGARSSRYIFPIFPGLALCAGYWMDTKYAGLAAVFRRWIVPLLLLLGAAVFWIQPSLLAGDENAEFKANSVTIQRRIPKEESLPYLGGNYWRMANPLLYYTDRLLQQPSGSAKEAVGAALKSESGLLLCDRDRSSEITQPFTVLLESKNWLLISPQDHP